VKGADSLPPIGDAKERGPYSSGRKRSEGQGGTKKGAKKRTSIIS